MQNIEKLTISNRKILRRSAIDLDTAQGTLIILHGYGADEYDLMSLAPYLDAKLQILSIRGSGSVMYGGASWFDIEMDANGDLHFNGEQAMESAEGVINLIKELQEQGIIPEKKIILGGFSQGATISQLISLKQPDLIKALLIMSGRLTARAIDLLNDDLAIHDLPVFAGHGTHDNVIPVEFGRQIVSFWQKLPVNLEHHEYAMGHEICQDELTHIQQWLSTIN